MMQAFALLFLYIFQILRGADRNIDFVVKSPTGKVIGHHRWTHEGTTDTDIAKGEAGKFAFDHSTSIFLNIKYIFKYWNCLNT